MLTTIRGDVFEFIIICNVETSLILKVVFKSAALNIRTEAMREEDIFRVRIEGDVTKDFPIGFARYDIIATLLDGEELTVKRSKVEVLNRGGEMRSG